MESSSDDEGEAVRDEAVDPSHPAFHAASTEDSRVKLRDYDASIHHPAYVLVVKRSAAAASDLKAKGNAAFKIGDFHAAAELYGDAIDHAVLGTDEEDPSWKYPLAVFHANRAACWMKIGDYEPAIDDCTTSIELDPTYVKAYMRRAQACEKMDDLTSAIEDVSKVCELQPSMRLAFAEKERLTALETEKNEKMKEEMMGKLKDLGNTVLGKFGMSLDNFQMKQDPETGSYSMNFKQ